MCFVHVPGPDPGAYSSPLRHWLSGFVREWIPLSQKARPFFLVLCPGSDGPSSIWTHTAVSGAVWGSTNCPSLHWIHLRCDHFATSSQIMGQSLYVLKGMQLLLKKAPKKRNSAGLLWVPAGERMTLVIEGWLGSVFSPSCWLPRWKSRYTSLTPVSLLTQGKVFVHLLNLKYCKGGNI